VWHAPNGAGYASVRVEEHWENYRIKSNAFEQWVRAEYGRQNQVKIGEQWIPQVPGTQALRDAIATLESYAKFRGKQFQPAVRVGGNREVIYLDLGGPEWNAVEITAQGWRVVNQPNVAFIRTGTMLPMPVPLPGGSINELRTLLNVQRSDFVLVVGWLLQAMNPIGPYPLIDAHGLSEAGKTWLCKQILRVVDPNSTGLRKAKKVEDLLIAARNNWTIGFDNLSWMSTDWADTLCMLATGIATGGRALYTDDEEHTFTVQRPVLFNGIPVDLTERSDLASRTIKLEIPEITKRRTEYDLEKEFEAIWPRVLGALLDGLVGALAGWEAIEADDPARLIDFEKFAEAGCRAMGFDKWEFVEAYKSNRHGSMLVAAEASAVGRAIVAFLKANRKGFRGQISALYKKLEMYRGNAHWNDWPRSPTKLSSELSRVSKPLAALNIRCLTKVDRRGEGGTQKDAVVEWKTQPLELVAPKLELVRRRL
jgi:putative DNA primase/helicase